MSNLIRARFSFSDLQQTAVFYGEEKGRFFVSFDGALGKKILRLTCGEWAWLQIGPFEKHAKKEIAALSEIHRFKELVLQFIEHLGNGNSVFSTPSDGEVTLTATDPVICKRLTQLQEKQRIIAWIAYPFEDNGFGEIRQVHAPNVSNLTI